MWRIGVECSKNGSGRWLYVIRGWVSRDLEWGRGMVGRRSVPGRREGGD